MARLRLDATLHEPPGPQPEGKRDPKPKKGLVLSLTHGDSFYPRLANWRAGL